MNVDYEEALVGADVPKLLHMADKLADSADDIRDKYDLKVAMRAAKAIGLALRNKARTNVDYASKAGMLPTRYLGIDSERQFPGGIPALTTNTVNVNPSVDVRVVGFRTDDTFAADFNITRIDVATINLIVGQDGCPASMFTAGISLPPTSAPVLPGGSAADIAWQNISGAPRRGRGGFPILKISDPAC